MSEDGAGSGGGCSTECPNGTARWSPSTACRFEVRRGEFFGLLGPNGAGKTTLVEIVEGMRAADAGRVTVLGASPWPRDGALLRRIGVQTQSSAFFTRLTAAEHLETVAALYGLDRAAGRPQPGAGRAGREGRRPGRRPVRRPAAAAGDRDRAGARAGADLPRRADRRAGHRGPPRALGRAAQPEAAGPDGLLHHPPHGRGAGAVRPGGHPRPRPAGRAGHPGQPDPVAAGADAAQRAGRPGAGGGRRRCWTGWTGPGRTAARWCWRPARPAGCSPRWTRSADLDAVRTRSATLEDAYLALTGTRRRGMTGLSERAGPAGAVRLPGADRANYRAYVRDRTTLFFTFAFPLFFLGIFGLIFRGQTVEPDGLPYINYIAPGVLSWGVGNAARLRGRLHAGAVAPRRHPAADLADADPDPVGGRRPVLGRARRRAGAGGALRRGRAAAGLRAAARPRPGRWRCRCWSPGSPPSSPSAWWSARSATPRRRSARSATS